MLLFFKYFIFNLFRNDINSWGINYVSINAFSLYFKQYFFSTSWSDAYHFHRFF
ncbi:hypothetical protein AB28_5298 [Raoultella ornithinolytica 2-156-04_S1_C2]|nr:hypothetical protein AB28_5298 [Raoultella ornithinolytica 2-156-04_S1_C2]